MAGADNFIFNNFADSDTIFDWQDGSDKLNFAAVTAVTSIANLTINFISATQTNVTYNDGGGTETLTVLSAAAFTLDVTDFIF